MKHMACMERLRDLGCFSLLKWRLRPIQSLPVTACDRAVSEMLELFLVVGSSMRRGKSHKLQVDCASGNKNVTRRVVLWCNRTPRGTL